MMTAKIVLLIGAMLGALASYVLAGRATTPMRAIGAAVVIAGLFSLVTGVAAHFGAVPSSLARPLIGGFGAVFASMMALSHVVLAPATEKRYLAAALYGASAFLFCVAVFLAAAKLLP